VREPTRRESTKKCIPEKTFGLVLKRKREPKEGTGRTGKEAMKILKPGGRELSQVSTQNARARGWVNSEQFIKKCTGLKAFVIGEFKPRTASGVRIEDPCQTLFTLAEKRKRKG